MDNDHGGRMSAAPMSTAPHEPRRARMSNLGIMGSRKSNCLDCLVLPACLPACLPGGGPACLPGGGPACLPTFVLQRSMPGSQGLGPGV